MTDYSELVKDLRNIEKTMFALGTSPINMDNVSIRLAYDKRWGQTANDAAAAIEELQAEVQFYNALADLWQSAAENKERLLGLYRAEQAKHFYSAMDDNGRIKVNPCACTNIPVFPDSSESPNS